jgi:hypothetical protein
MIFKIYVLLIMMDIDVYLHDCFECIFSHLGNTKNGRHDALSCDIHQITLFKTSLSSYTGCLDGLFSMGYSLNRKL